MQLDLLETRAVPALILETPVPYTTGDGSQGEVVADFNGDGLVDLTTADSKDGTVSVLLGRGDGTFDPRIVTPGLSNVVGLSQADFNNDGRLDLVAGLSTGDVFVLLGLGDGTFGPPVALSADGSPTSVVASDLNGDGNPDVAAGQQTGDLIRVWFGAGAGTFAAPVTYTARTATFDLEAVDLNGDGAPDLVAAEANAGVIGVLLNQGDGSFDAGSFYSARSGPTSIGVGDFNGDGFVDVAATNQSSSDVSVYLGHGDGTFEPQAVYSLNSANSSYSAPNSVVAVDLDEDGIQDLAVAEYYGSLAILKGVGDGTFLDAVRYDDRAPSNIVSADFNRDGLPDLATTSYMRNYANVFLLGPPPPPPPTIRAGDVSVTEGDTGTTDAVFTVTLDAPSAQTITVDYRTLGFSATDDLDFTPVSGTLTFEPGTTSLTLAVPVLGDRLNEGDEKFTLLLSNPTNAPLGTERATGTILNDDPLPSISIGDVSIVEGDDGSRIAVIPLTLSEPSGQEVLVDYATAGGTATPGVDFSPVDLYYVIFSAGSTSTTLTVLVTGDRVHEPDETFFVDLSNPRSATIARGRGTATIVNDDAPPAVSVEDVRIVEGDDGTRTATFRVTLSASSSLPVTVGYGTTRGTAEPGVDFAQAQGTLIFDPGTTAQTVSVPVFGDLAFEPDETFFLDLGAATNASLGRARGTATIVNDDAAPPVGPHVIDVARYGYHAQPTKLVLTFDEALDRASASSLSGYRLIRPGRDGRFGTRDDRVIVFREASYDAERNSVTLTLRHRLPLKNIARLVASGLSGADGTAFDGDGDGQPGGRFVAHVARDLLRGASTTGHAVFRQIQLRHAELVRDSRLHPHPRRG